jgi:hypothetical protein
MKKAAGRKPDGRSGRAQSFDVALHRGMNLAPVPVENANGDGRGRPVNIGDKRDCANSVPRVREQFANDAGRTVEELDSVLHPQRSTAPLAPSSNIFAPSPV